MQGTCTGLRVRCSARTAEVFSAAGGGIANSFYECTLRGIAAESEKDIFALEYKLRVCWGDFILRNNSSLIIFVVREKSIDS